MKKVRKKNINKTEKELKRKFTEDEEFWQQSNQEDDWIRCNKCKHQTHEACASYNNDDGDFTCEL